jgi:DNA modification methylase
VAVVKQEVSSQYAIYQGDCIEVMSRIPDQCVDLSVYSPPFCGLYQYSSDDRDLSNVRDYDEFFEHYTFVLRELARLTKPGRITAVHCADVPTGNTGRDSLIDFPGDIIRKHTAEGWLYIARYCVWKEPFRVRMRTLAKGLAHRTIIDDASRCNNAAADYLLIFRKVGEADPPIRHPEGFTDYAGARPIPPDVVGYRGWTGSHLENRYSHWVWRQYASAFWDDVRIDRILPFEASKDELDERHIHPLQLDVIDRVVVLWSNPGDVVLTPFMGIGSEVYSAIQSNRRAIGIELKPTYYRQALKNLNAAIDSATQQDLLGSRDLRADLQITQEGSDAYEERVRSAASRSGRWLGKSK